MRGAMAAYKIASSSAMNFFTGRGNVTQEVGGGLRDTSRSHR